jgi:alcohol dehydrogenase, propanol-preferring
VVSRVESELAIVGFAGGSLRVAVGRVPWETAVAIPTWGSAVELMEVLELVREGQIRPHVAEFPLERVEDAYAQLRQGRLDGRAVIVPHG